MNLRTLAAFVIGLAAAGAVSAQSVTVRAKIPFSFVVNGTTLPAGEYTLRQENSPGTMIIRGTDHGVGAMTVVAPPSAPARVENPGLVFHAYGNQYFLFQIWTSGDQGSQIPRTHREREVSAHRNTPRQVVVAAVR